MQMRSNVSLLKMWTKANLRCACSLVIFSLRWINFVSIIIAFLLLFEKIITLSFDRNHTKKIAINENWFYGEPNENEVDKKQNKIVMKER